MRKCVFQPGKTQVKKVEYRGVYRLTKDRFSTNVSVPGSEAWFILEVNTESAFPFWFAYNGEEYVPLSSYSPVNDQYWPLEPSDNIYLYLTKKDKAIIDEALQDFL